MTKTKKDTDKNSPAHRWGSNTRKDSAESGRDIILDAAVACYEKKGIAGTTIDDIASLAKISRRTVYRYFPNKQSIIQEIVDEQAAEFFKGMDNSVKQFSNGFLESLKNCMLYTIENGPKAPGHELLLGKTNASISSQHYFNSENIYQYWDTLLRPSFEQALKARELATDISFDDLMSWSARIIYSYIQFPEPLEKIEKQIDHFLLRNLQNQRTSE